MYKWTVLWYKKKFVDPVTIQSSLRSESDTLVYLSFIINGLFNGSALVMLMELVKPHSEVTAQAQGLTVKF